MTKEYKKYVEKLNASPIFMSIAKNFNYNRIGLQVFNNEEITKEFTSHNKEGKIVKVEEGLKDPEVTIRIGEETVKQLTSKKEQEWVEKNPVEAAMKYSGKIEMPFMMKLKLLRLLNEI